MALLDLFGDLLDDFLRRLEWRDCGRLSIVAKIYLQSFRETGPHLLDLSEATEPPMSTDACLQLERYGIFTCGSLRRSRAFGEHLAALAVNCSALHTLTLNGCPGVTDVQPLACSLSLCKLDLKYCTGITDISPLAGCLGLVELNICFCFDVQDGLPTLASRGILHSVQLQASNRLRDVCALASCSSLNKLKLESMNIDRYMPTRF